MIHTGRVPRCSRPTVALGVLLLVGVACSSQDGRSLPPPDPAITTTTSVAPEIGPPVGAIDAFLLQSTAFPDGGPIPEKLTCVGEDVSPDLSWTGTPAEALELAIVVRDRNAAGFVHWVVTGIDPIVQGLGEGGIPEGAVEHANDTGTVGWAGPCPPAGSGVHVYEIILHALDARTDIPPGTSPEQAATLIESSSSQRAVLTGTVDAR